MILPKGPWVIVLAGGDGSRLDGATVLGRRLDRPKQFCCIGGFRSLLQATLRRAERITDRSHIVVMVRDEHSHWWREELAHLPSQNVLAQADNRGTAVAILHALVHVLQRDAHPTFVILPSDHGVTVETVLLESIGMAARIAARSREHLVLLGATPEHAETEYGWILPSADVSPGVSNVERFVEKPEARVAADLFTAGALWNTFVCAGSGQVLLELFQVRQPFLLRGYFEFLATGGAHRLAGKALFRALPCVDFSRDVLQSAIGRLRVLSVPPCGWTDLGTLQRVNHWLEQCCMPPPVAAMRRVEALNASGRSDAITA